MQINDRLNGKVLMEVDNLRGADLRGADLRYANLRYANLCGADLRDADLRGADLCGADLRGAAQIGANLCGADLRDANLDFSCWPLWCGSINVVTDERQQRQLIFHALNACKDNETVMSLIPEELKAWVREFHRYGECNWEL